MTIPTADDVRRVLDYNPQTGDFTWAVRVANRVQVGDLAGWLDDKGYRVISLGNKDYKAHRLAWLVMNDEWPQQEVDHINGVRSDNGIANLRDVPSQTNRENQRKPQRTNKSGLIGVVAYRAKWKAQISVGGKVCYLGLHETPELAHAAYVAAKRVAHVGCTL